jgi:hypothetical protein
MARANYCSPTTRTPQELILQFPHWGITFLDRWGLCIDTRTVPLPSTPIKVYSPDNLSSSDVHNYNDIDLDVSQDPDLDATLPLQSDTGNHHSAVYFMCILSEPKATS